MSRTRVLIAVAALTSSSLAACGGKTIPFDEPYASTGGTGASGGSGGTGGAAGSGGSGGSGGATGGSAGVGGMAGSGGVAGTGGSGGAMPDAGPPVSCGRTHDSFSMRAQLYDGRTFSCSGGTDFGFAQLQGQVVEMNGNALTIDSCPPNADCIQMRSTFTFDAPGLYLWIPTGAFVDVSLQVDQPWGCEQRILIADLPSWGGLPNPVPTGATVHLAAADGIADTLPGAPFTIQKLPLGCVNDPSGGCGGDPPDDYALHFASTTTPGDPGITVGMGQYATWSVPSASGVNEYWAVRNLRSYSSGYCDDYFNWSWWLTQVWMDAANGGAAPAD